MKNKFHTLKWFLNRKGKRIYRGEVSCPCHTCKQGTQEGIVVGNKMHAEYLFMVEQDRNMGITYRDEI